MLKVTVSEIQRTVLKQLGINTSGQWQSAGATGSFLTETPFSLSPQSLATSAITAGSGLNGLPNVTLRAAERAGVMRTLAEPTLTAISGESAKFTAGGDIPVPSGETCTSGVFTTCTTSVTYRPVGVVLNFTPIVLSEGRISLHVSTEVTEVDYENQIRDLERLHRAGASRPARWRPPSSCPPARRWSSAGLMQQASGQAINGVPGLMNVPILGAMFRSRDYQRKETELLVIVTPYIAKAIAAGRRSPGPMTASPMRTIRRPCCWGVSTASTARPRAPAAAAYRGTRRLRGRLNGKTGTERA